MAARNSAALRGEKSGTDHRAFAGQKAQRLRASGAAGPGGRLVSETVSIPAEISLSANVAARVFTAQMQKPAVWRIGQDRRHQRLGIAIGRPGVEPGGGGTLGCLAAHAPGLLRQVRLKPQRRLDPGGRGEDHARRTGRAAGRASGTAAPSAGREPGAPVRRTASVSAAAKACALRLGAGSAAPGSGAGSGLSRHAHGVTCR